MYHDPVLLHKSVDGLLKKTAGIYVDVTYGGGGHSKEILKNLDEDARLFAFDQDADAIANKINDKRLTLIQSNFSYIKNYLQFYKALPVDGILADLGVSSHQFDAAARGFSFREEAKLDLRMDKNAPLDACEVINKYSEKQLKKIFSLYGEVHNAGFVAKLIGSYRKKQEITTTTELKSALEKAVNKKKENQYLAQIFQALRIEVNGELEALKELLRQSVQVLAKGGRIVVISYHSLEDRIVKNFFKSGNFEGNIEKDFYGNPLTPFKVITKKPVLPTDGEIKRNNRARSAKLRIAEKK